MTFLFPVKNQQGTTMEGRPPSAAAPPARVSMFRRLMMVRVTPSERLAAAGDAGKERDKDERAGAGGGAEADVGSVALDKMVISFMESDSSSSPAAAAAERPPRGRCAGNCFNGSQDGISDDEDDFGYFLPSSASSASAAAASPAAAGDALELLKGLVQCASTAERNLLADASRIAERCGGGGGRKKADVRRAVAEGLRLLGYDAAVCTSRWDKTASHPAGEHEYIDAVVAAVESGAGAAAATVRLVVEVDFRSEFEVARPTKAYRAAVQALPALFVGTPERLGKVVAVVAEAARQSLRKRGLHFPPWRKHEYMRAKWLSPHARSGSPEPAPAAGTATAISAATFSGEFELRFDAKPKAAGGGGGDDTPGAGEEEDKKITVVVSPSPWRAEDADPAAATKLLNPPPPPPQAKKKVVTGLASLLLLAS